MSHAAHFLFLLALLAGMVVFVWSLQLYQQHRFAFLKSNLLAMGAFNLILLLNLGATYYGAILGGGGPNLLGLLCQRLPLVAFPLLLIMATWFFVDMMADLSGKRLAPAFKAAAALFALGILMVQGVFALRWPYFSRTSLPFWVMGGVEVTSLGTIWVSVLLLYRQAGTLATGSRQQALRRFAAILLCPISLLVLFSGGRWVGVLNGPALVLIGAALGASVLLTVLVFFQHFLPIYVAETRERMDKGSGLEALFQKFEISNREREVIRLICEGKPNKEIAADLFISLQTVKDHVSRIFVKVGVKNRVQLSKVFLMGTD